MGDVLRFVRAICVLCRKVRPSPISQVLMTNVTFTQKLNAAILIRHHVLSLDDPDEISRLLMQLCSYHIEVLPLSTGKSGAVSGQVYNTFFLVS